MAEKEYSIECEIIATVRFSGMIEVTDENKTDAKQRVEDDWEEYIHELELEDAVSLGKVTITSCERTDA